MSFTKVKTPQYSRNILSRVNQLSSLMNRYHAKSQDTKDAITLQALKSLDQQFNLNMQALQKLQSEMTPELKALVDKDQTPGAQSLSQLLTDNKLETLNDIKEAMGQQEENLQASIDYHTDLATEYISGANKRRELANLYGSLHEGRGYEDYMLSGSLTYDTGGKITGATKGSELQHLFNPSSVQSEISAINGYLKMIDDGDDDRAYDVDSYGDDYGYDDDYDDDDGSMPRP